MDVLYAKNKAESLQEIIKKISDEIVQCQEHLEMLKQQYNYYQGSLAVANELIDLYESKKGGSAKRDESN